jgi:hypothetical protein
VELVRITVSKVVPCPEVVENLRQINQIQQQIIAESIVREQESMEQFQAILEQNQKIVEEYKNMAESQSEAYKQQIKIAKIVIQEMTEKIAEQSDKLARLEEEKFSASGIWKYFTLEHWSSSTTPDDSFVENVDDDNDWDGEESADDLAERMQVAPQGDPADTRKLNEINRRLEALKDQDSTKPESGS